MSSQTSLKDDVATALILVFGSGWTVWYVNSTARNPLDGPEAVLLIKPLAVVLVITTAFSLFDLVRTQVVRTKATPITAIRSKSTVKRSETTHPERRRSIVIFSLPFLAGAITLCGFVVSSVSYVILMGYLLGVRSIGSLILSGLGVTIVIVLFQQLTGLPLPLWPSF